MKAIKWKSLKDVSYELDIYDDQAYAELVPSVVPFVTDVNNSNDFYEPIREQTGSINILGEVSVINGLLAASPAQRPVRLQASRTINGISQTTTVWKGYLQTQAFSQTWDKGPNEISLPVMSHLAIIESYNLETIEYLSFADFIKRMSSCTGSSFYSKFVFPAISNILTVLTYRICGRRFASYNDDDSSWEYGSYREILEEVCKVFGWVAIEYGATLCFIAPDSTAGYYALTNSELTSLASDTTPTYTPITQTTITDSIFGNEHQIDYLPGKKSIKVVGDYAEWDFDLWKLDTGKMTKADNATNEHTASIGGNDYLHYYTKTYQSNTQIVVDHNVNNLRLQNFIADDDNLDSGSCVVCDREFVTSDSDSYNPVVRDSGWMEHVIVKVKQSQAPKDVCEITPLIEHIRTGLFADINIIVKADIKYSTSYKNEWETYNGPFKMKIEQGTNVLFDDKVQVREGKMYSRSTYGLANAVDGVAVYGNSYSGAIKVTFSVSDDMVPGWYDQYYSIENLSISYIKAWSRHLEEAQPQNVVSYEIGGGWTDILEQTNMLTTMRTEQIGYGLILDASLNPISTLYNSTTPEQALVTRMRTHYTTSKKLITAQLAGNGEMLSPLHLHIPVSGSGMVCLAQSVNWRDEQITALLFEI